MSVETKNTVIQGLGLASYEISVSINMAQKAFRDLLKTCLGHHELTVPEWTLLGTLYASESIRPVKAAKLLGIKPPFLAKLINGLESRGLVMSKQFDDDGRGKEIVLTDEGKNLVNHVEEKLQLCINEQLSELKQSDLKIYFMMTNYIAQNLHHHNQSAAE